ncbi:MAG: hypothetical protein IJ532_08375 [Alphaproteobacteria bacterium]|nr:hypothetical protein [Alphaproteobacteria bacterium]
MQLSKIKRFAQMLWKGSNILILLCILFSEANAKVCFLPGRCTGDSPDNPVIINNLKAIQGNQCLGVHRQSWGQE